MRAIIFGLLALSLTACAGGERTLRNLDTGNNGPDEFSVTPSLPLELPEDLSLPTPTPGGANLTDTNPIGSALSALGGRQISAGGVPSADAGLVAFASRNGVEPDIRATLAAADEARRARASRFSLNPFRRGDR